MARHGCGPFAPDRRGIDAGDGINRKVLELAEANPPFDAVYPGADRVEHPLPPLRDLGLYIAFRRRVAEAVPWLRITGEKLAVGAHQRVEASRAVADERVELLEILRHDGDRNHAVEGAVGRGAPPRQNEERRSES